MPDDDLSIYTLDELEELRDNCKNGLRVLKKEVAPLPVGGIPALTLIQIDSFVQKIARYSAEIARRKHSEGIINPRTGRNLQLFLSYRRRDGLAMGSIGRFREILAGHFGDQNIFLDDHSIPYGTKFRALIEGRVQQSDVMLGIMGHQWIELLNNRDPADFDYVRFELETARNRGILIVPLLLESTQLPAKERLPDTLKWMCDLNAARVDLGHRFRADMDYLASRLVQNFA